MNAKRVERIWRREGLKVPSKQLKKARLWLHDGSASGSDLNVRTTPGPTTSWRSEEDQATVRGTGAPTNTHDGRKVRMLNVIDEFTHECLVSRVARKLKAVDVIDVLSDLFMPHEVCRATFAPTMTPSSWIALFRTGSKP